MPKLTDAKCKATKSDPVSDVLLGDGNGLYLRIRPGGTRVWMIDYLVRGRRRKINIGNYDPRGSKAETVDGLLSGGSLSLAQARFIAAAWKEQRREGRDPTAEREVAKATADKAMAAAAAQPSVTEAIEPFMIQHIDGKKSAGAIRYRFERLASALGGHLKVRDVTRQDVIAALEKIASGQRKGRSAKQLAGEVLTTAKRLWRFAESREWVAESCIERLTRANFDARPNKREVALRLDELAEVWRALGDSARCKADPVTVAAMRILILTGQRECEVTDATWSEFDLEAGLWRIPAARTKSARAHLIHLAPQAVAILDGLRALTGHKQHVFASPLRKGQSIYGRSVNNALLSIYKRGGLPNVTPCHVHDFRRTLVSRLPDLGVESFIGHKIANHRLPGVLGIYNHAEYLSEREIALKKWADRIELLATEEKVIQGTFRHAA
jgi:integrase